MAGDLNPYDVTAYVDSGARDFIDVTTYHITTYDDLNLFHFI